MDLGSAVGKNASTEMLSMMSVCRLLTIVLARIRLSERHHWSAVPGQQSAGRSGYYPIIGGGRRAGQGRCRRIKSGKAILSVFTANPNFDLIFARGGKGAGSGPWTASDVRARDGMFGFGGESIPVNLSFSTSLSQSMIQR